jgi:hypothetical protein
MYYIGEAIIDICGYMADRDRYINGLSGRSIAILNYAKCMLKLIHDKMEQIELELEPCGCWKKVIYDSIKTLDEDILFLYRVDHRWKCHFLFKPDLYDMMGRTIIKIGEHTYGRKFTPESIESFVALLDYAIDMLEVIYAEYSTHF